MPGADDPPASAFPTAVTPPWRDTKVVKPAYPLGPRFAGPRQGLAGGCAPCDPPNGNGT